jgi:hypothetical protein
VLALVGCSKSSDDNKSNSGNGQLEQKSVIGESTKVGVFPDGTPAQPLTSQQMDQVGKTAEGVMKVNQAVAGVTPASLQSSGDVQVEAVQAFMRSPVTRTLMGLREALTDVDQFKHVLQGSCTAAQSHDQPTQSGSDTHKDISQKFWSTLSGANCPVESRIDVDMQMSADRTGDKSAHIAGGLNFASVTNMIDPNQALNFDFLRQTINGRMEGEANVTEQAMELVANGKLSGQVQTKTQGNVDAQILFDLHLIGQQPQQGSSISSQSVSASSMTLSLAVVMNTQNGKILLQVFASGSGQNSITKVYLNGQELKDTPQWH